MDIRQAHPEELDVLAAFAAAAQQRTDGHIAYLGEAADDIVSELSELGDALACTMVALDGQTLVGWLAAEIDEEIGRVWWLGPFADVNRWAEIADALLMAARSRLREDIPTVLAQEEACGDVAHESLTAWADRHGFGTDTASVALGLEHVRDTDVRPAAPVSPVEPMTAETASQVVALHDRYFAGAHFTGSQLTSRDETTILVIGAPGSTSSAASRIAGYVATEVHADSSVYIDFVAVDESFRGLGLGAELIRAVTRGAAPETPRFHLTVRADNTAARSLYRTLGFTEARVLVPRRLGFSLTATT